MSTEHCAALLQQPALIHTITHSHMQHVHVRLRGKLQFPLTASAATVVKVYGVLAHCFVHWHYCHSY